MIMLSVVIVMILRECYIFSVDTLYNILMTKQGFVSSIQ